LTTNVYIDGFNFDYGAVRKTPYRWLNVERLCQLLLPKLSKTHDRSNQIFHRPGVSAIDRSKPAGKTTNLFESAEDTPQVSVHFGHFLTHEVTMALVVPPGQPQKYAKVIKTEEKGSDVNLDANTACTTQRIRGRFTSTPPTRVLPTCVATGNSSSVVEPTNYWSMQLRTSMNRSSIPCKCCTISANLGRLYPQRSFFAL
jgi:hypothetical protein